MIGRRLASLFDLLVDDRIEIVVCSELLDEIRMVTMRPKFVCYFAPLDVERLLAFIALKGEFYSVDQTVHLCRDAADDYLLGLAKMSKAHYLLTGDEDLLVLNTIGSCKIVDIKTFEMIFASL